MKSAIKKTIAKKCLNKSEFEVCLAEVAASINSRPLSFVGTDVESKSPLTPNHFLSGMGSQSLQSSVLEDPENVGVECLSLRHQEMREREEDFWKCWSLDYIRNLPPVCQKFKKQGSLSVGSVVLVREDNLPRMKWLVGVVQQLHSGKDGVVRAVDVRTHSGVKTRAVQRLHNLEIDQGSLVSDDCGSHVRTQQSAAEAEDVGGSEDVAVDRSVDGEVVDKPAEGVDEAVVSENVDMSANQKIPFRTRSGRVCKPSTKYSDFVCYK